jgi:serpin B
MLIDEDGPMQKLARSVFLSLVTLAACGGSGSGTSASNPVDSTSIARAQSQTRDPASSIPASALNGAVAANNAFAADLYARIRAGVTDANLITSPLSASVALTMAYAGAKGATASEMATALHFDPAAGSIFDGQNALTAALSGRAAAALAQAQSDAKNNEMAPPADLDFQLSVVNSVWGQKTWPWEPAFLDLMAKSYGTGIYLEDFAGQPDPARQAINAWVSTQTANKINDLLPVGSIDGSTRMVLVNAIHLKLPWATPFVAGTTKPVAFARADGTSVADAVMNETLPLPYIDDGAAQIVALPLAGGELAAVFALPHGDLATYEATLGGSGAAALAVPATTTQVQVELPQVTFTSPAVSLATALQAMGMQKAFDRDRADFTGLCSASPDGGKLFVSDVLQKAMLSIQETGVEAAAATAVNFAEDAIAEQMTDVNLDRPFLVSIVDKTTGAVLFLGEIGDPSQMGTP